jgi:hypothetical protein
MVNTRNCNINVENNNAENNNAENNNADNLPPTLEQVLMMQAQMLQTMQQTMVNMQNAQPQAPPPPPRDRLGDFQRTKPPTFSHSIEPIDADDWLKTVEKKLQVVQCNNREKVYYRSSSCFATVFPDLGSPLAMPRFPRGSSPSCTLRIRSRSASFCAPLSKTHNL